MSGLFSREVKTAIEDILSCSNYIDYFEKKILKDVEFVYLKQYDKNLLFEKVFEVKNLAEFCLDRINKDDKHFGVIPVILERIIDKSYVLENNIKEERYLNLMEEKLSKDYDKKRLQSLGIRHSAIGENTIKQIVDAGFTLDHEIKKICGLRIFTYYAKFSSCLHVFMNVKRLKDEYKKRKSLFGFLFDYFKRY